MAVEAGGGESALRRGFHGCILMWLSAGPLKGAAPREGGNHQARPRVAPFNLALKLISVLSGDCRNFKPCFSFPLLI